jgi:hypothetical protein
MCPTALLISNGGILSKRYPRIDLKHNTEPSPKHLQVVDDNASDPEPLVPDPDIMSGEDYLLAMKAVDAQRKLLEFRNSEVRRRVVTCLSIYFILFYLIHLYASCT